jgi:hypothetical protein
MILECDLYSERHLHGEGLAVGFVATCGLTTRRGASLDKLARGLDALAGRISKMTFAAYELAVS